MTGDIGNFFGLCSLFCLYPHDGGIGLLSRWGTWTLVYNPVDFLSSIPRPCPGFRLRWPGCWCLYCCLVCPFEVELWGLQPFGCWSDDFLWLPLAMTCLVFVGDTDCLLVFFSLSGLCPGPVFDRIYVHSVVFCWESSPLVCCCFMSRNQVGLYWCLMVIFFISLLYLFLNRAFWTGSSPRYPFFSTFGIIWVNHQVLNQLYPLIFFSFRI